MTDVLKGFYVLEGLDGSGTTTQLNRLKMLAKKRNYRLRTGFEPTDGAIGRFIREILGGNIHVEAETLARLFSADRHEHLYQKDNGILAALNSGSTVVCDRYLFSSLAYQGLDCDLNSLAALNRFPLPETVFFLETSPEECAVRRSGRDHSEIYENIDLQRHIREKYREVFALFADSGMQYREIDGSLDPAHISEKIWSHIRDTPKSTR